jgi:class 3 adenylate cyclase
MGPALDHSCAILFADISGSTRLYELLGDARARAAVAACLAVLAAATARQGGRVVKTIGDEIMATFPTADDAVAAATAMQERVARMPPIDGQRLSIRIGVQHGPVVTAGDDVFGDAVNVAARLAAQAKADEILTEDATLRLLAPHWRALCRHLGPIPIKGKAAPLELCEVVWQATEATMMRAPTLRLDPDAARGPLLVLSGAGRRAEIDARRPILAIGRSDEAGFVVPVPSVSRQHARIEWRQGRFTLTDQSANGTYVLPDGGALGLVHRASCDLTGTGALGLGEAPAEGAPAGLRYEIAG